MQFQDLHSWDTTPKEAQIQQTALRSRVSLNEGFEEIKTIAGLDLSYNEEKNEGYAVVVVLSFWESPIALEAFKQLETVPERIQSPFGAEERSPFLLQDYLTPGMSAPLGDRSGQ